MTFKRFTLLLSIFVMAASVASPVFADAADTNLTPKHIATIRQNCIEAQSTLQRIQRNDVVVRTNRGRSYDGMLKLMDALNARIKSNSVIAPKLEDIRASLQQKFKQFYSDFTKYDSSITDTIHIGCGSQPEVFYATLTQTRGLRVQLANDIKDMDMEISNYKTAVAELRDSIRGLPKRSSN